ncbi:unnamed protein product [Calicophoron daubneyi]|uniref:Protein FAM91A1 n=1 Tax=Calicophoron daubneyi TaxID=300641 RepID=A0AAV2U110_CALDB
MDLEDKIAANTKWSDLPPKLRFQLHDDPKEYERRIVIHSLQNQLRYNGNLVQHVLRREKKYYEKLVEYSRIQFLLYPYHLQDKIVPGLKITPFIYYRDMLVHLVRTERSYDCLPNFTAADCLRVLGVGRNQYIEVMNTYKSFLTTAGPDSNDNLFEILYDIFPHEPKSTLTFEPWHIVRIGAVLVEDVDRSSKEERDWIDRIIDAEHCSESGSHPGMPIKAVDLDVIKQLYCRGLVYIDVPVNENDRICVPTLEGFVMNRVNGDNRENLLYKIFVSADENTTIGELADCLKVDVNLVAQAASIFCRLGFAYKRPPIVQDGLSKPHFSDSESVLQANSSLNKSPSISPRMDTEVFFDSNSRSRKKLAFIFDSTVTAYLMMGNLSAGLKPHAVTMFEVGKLSDDSLEAFLSELDNLSKIDEGEAKLYYEHALNLREAIRFFRKQALLESTDFCDIDLIRGGSLLSLEQDTRMRILRKNYNLIVSISPMTYEDRQASISLWLAHIGPPTPEANSPWFRLFVSHLAGKSDSNVESEEKGDDDDDDVLPIMLLARGARTSQLPSSFLSCSRFLLTLWGHDPVILGSSSLLCSVNDMLLASPVVVQALDIFHTDEKLYQRYIPLPLSKTLMNADAPTMVPSFLHRLNSHLDLSSLSGYITVLAPAVDGDSGLSDENAPECKTDGELEPIHDMNAFSALTLPHLDDEQFSSNSVIDDVELLKLMEQHKPIYFITLHLGFPIFNNALLSAVCTRLTDSETNLLTPARRPQLEQANKRLVDKLSDFIYHTCSAEWPISDASSSTTLMPTDDQLPGPWPLPVRSVLCASGRLVNLT